MMDSCQDVSEECYTKLSRMALTTVRSLPEDSKTWVDFNNVRITPPRIDFKGAFEGKLFKTKITMQNIGKTSVLVRMAPPTSYAYKIKCFPRGIYLSPGLTIERSVELVYNQICVKLCILPIYVNEQRYDFEVEVAISTSDLKVVPSFIDFGCVDAGLTSPPKLVEIVNVGSKGTRYSFDLVEAQHEFIIEPTKGYLNLTLVPNTSLYKSEPIEKETVFNTSAMAGFVLNPVNILTILTTLINNNYPSQSIITNTVNGAEQTLAELFDIIPKQATTISLRLLTYKEGMINTELWIRSEIPKVIAVKGMVIVAKFEAIHPNATSTFTVVDFPTTYYTASYTKNLLVRNYSSSNSMFCVLGELRDGRILVGNYFEDETSTKAPISNANNVSTASFFGENLNAPSEAPLFRSSSSARDVNIGIKVKRPYVRVYLHGLAEDPNVTVVPDALVLLELKVNTQVVRVLELQNNSTKLPIILHYKKVAYIELERNIFLKPNEKKQIPVVITHHCIGILNTQIEFDLIHYDSPKVNDNCRIVGNVSVSVTLESLSITKYPSPTINPGLRPNYIKEVGKFCDGLKYSNIMDRPKLVMVDIVRPADKHCNDLIAFPNDRLASLRPWRETNKCTTMFTRTPRYVPPLEETYELSIFDREFKREVSAFYTAFTRREAQKLKSLQKTPLKIIEDEYYFAETYKVNFNNVPTFCGIMKPNQTVVKADSFMPLSPVELNLISVSPTVVETGKIACYHGYNINVVITNANNFSLRLYFKADKPVVLFPQTSRRIIPPNSQNQIEIVYMAGPPGYYVVTIDVLINESSITQVVILADVVPHTLQLNTYYVQLTNGETLAYIDIINTLNVSIRYFWDIPFCNFCVEPYSGCVRPYNSLTCVLTYYSQIGGPNVADFEFHSGDTDVQFLKVTCELPNEKIELITKEVAFENIPLNIRVTRSILFRNPFKQALSFSIIDSELGEDLEVQPRDGVVAGRQLIEISLSAKFQNCVKFSTSIKIDITKMGIFEIPVSGNVVYPSLKFTPETYQFRRVPFSSTDSLKFSIKNRSRAMVMIQINLNDYQEYKVSLNKFHWEASATEEYLIEPDNTIAFYLHYMPMECAISTLYLPVVVNGILGPAIISDPITLKVDYYLTAQYKSTQPVSVPVNLDVIKITGLTKAGKIIFSKLGIDFSLGIRTERRYKTKYDFKITNCQKEAEAICIRTDELQTKPFVLEPVTNNVTVHQNALVCSLEANQSAIISMEFCPEHYGYYKCFLPVYLRSDMCMSFHNVIELRGNYITPTITGERLTFVLPHTGVVKDLTIRSKDAPRKLTFYSRPIPLKIVACSTKKYIFRDHYKNCAIQTKTDLPGLTIQIQFETFLRHNETDYEVEMTFKYSAEENTQFVSIVQIFCSCGASWEANLIGCAENCFLTSYAFSETFLPDHLEAVAANADAKKGYSMDLDARPSLMSAISKRDVGHLVPQEFHTMEFFSSYPFFPSEVTALTFFLERCLYSMEEWLCNQIFYKTIRYQIPETITYSYSLGKEEKIPIRSKKDLKTGFMVPPYAKLLINMVGSQMVTYLELGKPPKTEEGTCWYLYNMYANAIRFIKSLGAYFICLKPEHLLNYNMFVAYKKYILPTQETNMTTTSTTIKNSQEFYFLAKQSWLDLLLQTYKVLYLYRLSAILTTAPPNVSLCPTIPPLEEFKKSLKDFTKHANIFSNSELLLINWLEFHFMATKDEIWSDAADFPNRDVNFFGENLQDGLVFATVTGAYCPYMIPYLRKMYIATDLFEELLHNNCVITRCWKMLNCSFSVKPEDIVDPNSVQMLMLIAYLFEILPNMYPAETIEFKTGLSQKISNCIVLKNVNEFPICYKAIFFANCGDCFSTNSEFYIIQAGKSCKIIINYHAKHAKETQCTLLLSGESAGYHYARNRAFTLIGIPDITYMTSTVKYPIYLYQVSDVTFTIKSPYTEGTFYDMQIAYKMIEDLSDLETVPFVSKEEVLHLSRLVPNDTSCSFDEDGVCQFGASCSAVLMQDQTSCIYFRNKDVGDFAICVILQVKPSLLKEVLDVTLPKNFTELGYYNLKTEHIFIEIPSQNRLLWNTIKETMLRISEGDVLQFWQKNIGTPTGMQILQQIVLGVDVDYSPALGAVKYQIITERNCEVILPDSVTIENECSPDSVKIPVQFNNYNEIPRNFSFSLESADGRTRRYYVTNIVLDI